MVEMKDLTDKLKSPQWRAVIAFAAIFIILYLWAIYFTGAGPVIHTISYSQFIEQLNDGNIKSVSIKKLQINGELIQEVNILLPGKEKTTIVKNFKTFLPTFQGEDILSRLQERH
jgi:cell division protease FtsH